MKRTNLRRASRRSLGQRHSFRAVALASLTALMLAGCASGPPDAQPGTTRPSSSFAVPGLEKPAEVLVDRWGVPHLYAGTLYDAFVAQGFIAARDRLWQMDLWRKRGLGLAMLHHSFGVFYARGVTRCGLSVDARNASGAVRLYARAGMTGPPGLLDSQFKTLERPASDEAAVTVSIDATVEAIVDNIVRQLKLPPA